MHSRRTWLNVTIKRYYLEGKAGAQAPERSEHRQSEREHHQDIAHGAERVVRKRREQVEAAEMKE